MQSSLTVVYGDSPALRRVLLEGLVPNLHPPVECPEPRWICVAVGPKDRPVGGLIGLTTGAWFSIDLFWLPETLRGRGLGSAVLRQAEVLATAGGCVGAYLGTTSDSACRFYERNGYLARMRLPGVRPGLTQITLQKTFGDGDPPS